MRILPAALIGSMFGLSLFVGGCQDKKLGEHNDTMTLDQVPPKVRQSLRNESDTPIESINRHEFKGNVVYEATVQSEGKMWDVEVDQEGRLLRRQQRAKAQ